MYSIEVVLLGDTAVGKTELISQLGKKAPFNPNYTQLLEHNS